MRGSTTWLRSGYGRNRDKGYRFSHTCVESVENPSSLPVSWNITHNNTAVSWEIGTSQCFGEGIYCRFLWMIADGLLEMENFRHERLQVRVWKDLLLVHGDALPQTPRRHRQGEDGKGLFYRICRENDSESEL